MRLADAAAHFDNTLCADAFAPTTQFYGQLDLYDDSRRDGSTVVRRILSVAPSVAIPARRALTIDGEQWLVGGFQADSFAGSAVRHKYVLHRADGAATIQSVAQALSTGGTPTYGAKLWVKDFKEVDVSSKLFAFVNIYLPTPETVVEGQLIALGGRLHFVRNTFVSAAGFLVAESDELASDALTTGSYAVATYAPATDTNTLAAGVAVNVLQTRYQDDYRYQNQVEPRFKEGDIKAFVTKAAIATAKSGDQLTIGATAWLVHSVLDEGTSWGLHLRHV